MPDAPVWTTHTILPAHTYTHSPYHNFHSAASYSHSSAQRYHSCSLVAGTALHCTPLTLALPAFADTYSLRFPSFECEFNDISSLQSVLADAAVELVNSQNFGLVTSANVLSVK